MFNNNPKKSRAKHVRFGDRLYPKILQLSSSYYNMILGKHCDEIVLKMEKKYSDNVRYLGKAIIEIHFGKGRGELHSTAADYVQMDLTMHDAMYYELELVYVLAESC